MRNAYGRIFLAIVALIRILPDREEQVRLLEEVLREVSDPANRPN